MDVLKQKLNDIGACIGYPFYFFEDGSFSSTFVCGKMNACLVVKGAFAESDKCFFASAEIAQLSEVKVTEKKWTQKSVVPNTVNWFKKYLNDIGTALNYPFYVFDDGAYAKTSSLDGKQAILYVKKLFTSVEGGCTFFSTDSRKVLQFNEDLKKLKQQLRKRKEIILRMLAGENVSDEDALLVVENETHDLVKRCIHSVWQEYNHGGFIIHHMYDTIFIIYRKTFYGLVKKNWWDIYCVNEDVFKYYCLRYEGRQDFFPLFFQYGTPEILEKMLGLFLTRHFGYALEEKYCEHTDAGELDITYFRRRAVEYFRPLYLIERKEVQAYKVYRKYIDRLYLMCREVDSCVYEYYFDRFDFYFDEEFDAIVALEERDLFKILLNGNCLSNEQKAKLIQTGNIDMIQTYIECCGIDEEFRELLLNSGNVEIVALAQVNVISNAFTCVKHFFSVKAKAFPVA